MIVDVNDIVSKWEKDEPRYRKLGVDVKPILSDLIYDNELFPEISFRVKDLLSIIRKLKKKNLTEDYSYERLPDKLGFRIICSFLDEMDILDSLIKKNFVTVKIEKKREALDFNRLDYISNHYDLKIDASNEGFHHLAAFNDLVFELQVKTLNQHSWSYTSHALSYKQEANLTDTFKRKVFRLLSLYEIADDEFAIVNRALKEDPDNTVYSILRKTEGKIYKYARVDFDRELSLYILNKLISYLDEDELRRTSKEIESFIAQNEVKIRQIFKENAARLHAVPFLARPEIFVIWYILEKFPFSITDNWENDFDPDDLDQIRGVWGKEV